MAVICLDLDGTLVDALPAVHHGLLRCCASLGLPAPGERQAASQIGFGVRGLLEALPGIQEAGGVDLALERYWRFFDDECVPLHRVFPGVPLLLARLKRQGHRICLVTAKPGDVARRILHHHDLMLCFDEVFGGSTRTGWTPKAMTLEEPARRGLLAQGGFLVGDRGDDMRAARAHGLRGLGAAWGYGSPQELEEAGAEAVLKDVAELDGFLAWTLRDPERHDPFTRAE